jgi:hypothetical protein
MDRDEIGWVDVNCINLAQDEDRGWTLVSTVVNFHFKCWHSVSGVEISCTPKLLYLWGQKKSDIDRIGDWMGFTASMGRHYTNLAI